MWFRKKQLESEEYIKLLTKFAELSTEVSILSTDIKVISNRRWGADRLREEKRAKENKTENLKSNDGLDLLRGLNKDGNN